MILFRLVSWPYVRKHALRSLLTIAGIVIGVSVFFAMHAANESVFNAFQETVRRIAGATELQITAGDPGFSEDVLDRVQSLPQVAVAAPVIEAVANTGLAGQGNLLVLGVDLTGDRSLRDYQFDSGDAAVIDDPLVFLAQPDSIILTADYAKRNNIRINSKISLVTADGVKHLTVRGLLKSSGFASAFGGNLAVMDIYAAEQVFGRGRRFDRIDIALTPGVSLHNGQAALRTLLGPGFEVQPPASRGQSFQSMLRIYYFILNFSSAFALVVGMFIIYSSFSIAVTQRRKEIGILRALGATRRQIAILFLGESAAGGLIGSALGVGLGYFAAGVMARTIDGILQGVYGVVQDGLSITPSPALIAVTIAVGVITSMIAAGIPARNAAGINPIQALQKGAIQNLSSSESRWRIVLATGSAAIGVIILAVTSSLAWFYAGYLFVMLAAVLLTPILSQQLAKVLRVVLRWARPVEGALAADSLIRSSRRTAATVGALMLSLALVIGLAGTARASYNSIMGWVSSALNSDFFVSSSPTLTGNNYRFPDSMTPQLAAIDGIQSIFHMRTARINFQGDLILLVVPDSEKLAQLSPPPVVAGNPKEMFRLLAEGKAVIGSENLASLRHLKLGDQVGLPTPKGLLRLPLAGLVREYSDQNGEIFLDRKIYEKYWNDNTVDHFRVFLKPGADPAQVRQAILTKFAANRQLFVLSNREVRNYIAGLTDQWFGITWVQISIAILVAILGIINSLTVTIADRRRELGVLQAVGGLRSQIRLTIWIEAAGIACIGLILGLALGAIHLYYVLQMTYRDYPGLRFDYSYPSGVALLLLPIILTAALVSAFGPAEAAVRGSLVEALEYE
ncbi:MAG TPA: FtsX-like permease family protein [Bryobacteraceae bacterium]|nr:FtsX-like permease family protein [Bryobacteraceae bacterium]